MVFGTWMNSGDEIDYNEKNTVLVSSGAAQHTQWKLISSKVMKRAINIPSKDGKPTSTFPNLVYYFVIERHSSLYATIIIGKWSYIARCWCIPNSMREKKKI